jgi:hypothetical protein
MPEQNARRLPAAERRILANLQNGCPEAQQPPPFPLAPIAKCSIGGEPARTTLPVPYPLRRLKLSQLVLPDHRHHILRHRIERRYRLRVSLERPLRHNQIRKLC